MTCGKSLRSLFRKRHQETRYYTGIEDKPSPDLIPGLQFWYRANNGLDKAVHANLWQDTGATTVADTAGQSVYRWDDLSGNSYNATHTAATPGEIATADFAAVKMSKLDGIEYLDTGTPIGIDANSEAFTLFWVGHWNNPDDGTNLLSNLGAGPAVNGIAFQAGGSPVGGEGYLMTYFVNHWTNNNRLRLQTTQYSAGLATKSTLSYFIYTWNGNPLDEAAGAQLIVDGVNIPLAKPDGNSLSGTTASGNSNFNVNQTHTNNGVGSYVYADLALYKGTEANAEQIEILQEYVETLYGIAA